MLILKLRVGDDFYVGNSHEKVDTFQQVVLKSARGGFITMLTTTEVIELPIDQDADMTRLGVLDVEVSAKEDDSVPDLYQIGIKASHATRVLRGRVVRQLLD